MLKLNPEIFEPITHENISDLRPGDWIWDNKLIDRRAHKRSLLDERISEPIGFRLVHIIDLNCPGSFKPFMLSELDNVHGGFGINAKWTYFEEGRFYKFKEKENAET